MLQFWMTEGMINYKVNSFSFVRRYIQWRAPFGVRRLYLGIGVKAAKLNRVQVSNWWPEAVCIIILKFRKLFPFHVLVFFGQTLPFMETYHPMIYLLWRWSPFLPFNHLVCNLIPPVKIHHVPAPIIEEKDLNWGVGHFSSNFSIKFILY